VDGEVSAVQVRIGGIDLVVAGCIKFIPDIINLGAITLELRPGFSISVADLLGGGKAGAVQVGGGGPDLVVTAIHFLPDIINLGAIGLELGI